MAETEQPASGTESVPIVDWKALRDLVGDEAPVAGRRRRTLVLAAALVCWAVALVLLWITWDQVASRDVVADQLPFFASGGLGALVLAIAGGACFVAAFLPDRGSP